MKVPARRRGNCGAWRNRHLARRASMKVPARRRGNRPRRPYLHGVRWCLNESPRPKAGKWVVGNSQVLDEGLASMKVPARRRGSIIIHRQHDSNVTASMKVPARRRGNGTLTPSYRRFTRRLNESPRPKAGKWRPNQPVQPPEDTCLNESPRPKTGKSAERAGAPAR